MISNTTVHSITCDLSPMASCVVAAWLKMLRTRRFTFLSLEISQGLCITDAPVMFLNTTPCSLFSFPFSISLNSKFLEEFGLWNQSQMWAGHYWWLLTRQSCKRTPEFYPITAIPSAPCRHLSFHSSKTIVLHWANDSVFLKWVPNPHFLKNNLRYMKWM